MIDFTLVSHLARWGTFPNICPSPYVVLEYDGKFITANGYTVPAPSLAGMIEAAYRLAENQGRY